MASMILTGDVNLMNVDDPAVPFARVQEEFRAADIVFSNLECCLYDPPARPCGGARRLLRFVAIGGEALRHAGIAAVGIANNVNYGDAAITASIARLDDLGIAHTGAGANVAAARAPAIVERSGVRYGFLQRSSVYWPTNHEAGAELHRHRGDPRAHRVSGADAQDAPGDPADESTGHSAGDHHLGGSRLSARLHR